MFFLIKAKNICIRFDPILGTLKSFCKCTSGLPVQVACDAVMVSKPDSGITLAVRHRSPPWLNRKRQYTAGHVRHILPQKPFYIFYLFPNIIFFLLSLKDLMASNYKFND